MQQPHLNDQDITNQDLTLRASVLSSKAKHIAHRRLSLTVCDLETKHGPAGRPFQTISIAPGPSERLSDRAIFCAKKRMHQPTRAGNIRTRYRLDYLQPRIERIACELSTASQREFSV
jgi:hypothetical protein